MENLLPLIIFLAIALFSIVAKLREQKGEEDEKPPTLPRTRPGLPERTRRMLYGEPQVRPSRPTPEEHEGPVVLIPPPRPAQPRPVQSRQAQPSARRVQPVTPRQPAPAARPPATVMQRREMPPAARSEGKGSRIRPEDVKARLAAQPLARQRVAERQQAAPDREGPKPATAKPRAPLPMGKHRPALLKDLAQIRHGIILREILGPPVGLR